MSDTTKSLPRQTSASDGGGPISTEPKARSWDKFSQWVSCVCIVTFDLELGQAIEVKPSLLCVV